jgi:cell division protein FtsI/penicillin-binding protein 2
MMVSVVENVHGALARVDGYRIAGKTGTALIADTKSAGYIGDTNHTFVGFGPVEDPQYVILTKLEKPTSYEFSSGTAAPLFGEIAKFVLQYYNIPPTVE